MTQVKLPVTHTKEQLEDKIRKIIKLSGEDKFDYRIVRRSIDARKKPDLFYVYHIDVTVKNEASVMKRVHSADVTAVSPKPYRCPESGGEALSNPPVIVGAGPAGLFCAYLLARAGYAPVLIERGKPIEERTRDVEAFWNGGSLAEDSNVQFGEGGAGTFSDGKLNTLVKDSFGRNRFVLETFVRFGAPEQILYDAKPHIGTDLLKTVITEMRREVERLGGTVYFGTKLTGLSCEASGESEKLQLRRLEWNGNCEIDAQVCVLALGHSARDTFSMLERCPLAMEPKPFAVGFRVEHPQETVNLQQYGERYAKLLPAAPYKVTYTPKGGEGRLFLLHVPGRLRGKRVIPPGDARHKRHELCEAGWEKRQQRDYCVRHPVRF